ncbi:MAG: polymorphic toxin type 50 domain-containing protein [Ruminococcus sp.]|nr:polymorphic toxin type 50 domain-containing protein [Ruminococcus sp.]
MRIKEIVTLLENVGISINEYGINCGETNRMTVHYSKKRTHCVPAEKRNNDEA